MLTSDAINLFKFIEASEQRLQSRYFSDTPRIYFALKLKLLCKVFFVFCTFGKTYFSYNIIHLFVVYIDGHSSAVRHVMYSSLIKSNLNLQMLS